MTRFTLTLMVAFASAVPAHAQVGTTRPVIAGTLNSRPISPRVLQAAADAKLRSDLNTAKAQIAQMQATIAKMQLQLDKTTNDAFTTNFYFEKLVKLFNNHIHVVNGTVGVGLTSTVDGDKHVFRYVIPPYSNDDGLTARRTAGPIQPTSP